MKHNLIFGHRSPDTDSACAAIALSDLKNKLGEKSKPYVLGKLNKETQFVLNYFNMETPETLKNVQIQIKDLNYEKVKSINEKQSINYAYFYMNENKLNTLPIVDEHNNLLGLVTMKDIAMSLIKTDQRLLCTTYDNIVETLDGNKLLQFDEIIDGEIIVAAFEEKTLRKSGSLNKESIVIVGDRHDIIGYALEIGVKLIIVTGNLQVSDELIQLAKKNKVSIIITPHKTYYTAKNIGLAKHVDCIMKSKDLVLFRESDYLDDCKEDIQSSKHSKFPVISNDKKYLGILSRKDIISPTRKKVILVDHNEYGQSAEGIEQAEILEVVDHHKIGDIKTIVPISFRNIPVGSTNTIIFRMYRENGIQIDKKIAGLMLSGIISDTLMLKSPTTTGMDREAVNELLKIADVNLSDYAMEMFKAGTSLESKTKEEVFYEDFKKFNLEYNDVGISQVFTLDINQIMDNKEVYINLIDRITEENKYFLVIMAVTDIINEGSYIFYSSLREKLIESIFNKENVYQGVYVEDCVSRKKQIVPGVVHALNNIR
ncbi:MAG: inorganic pyrophosphatase [Bacillota bacterium]|nr:inorganic pyrophosphatase [Bacillota bacterium]